MESNSSSPPPVSSQQPTVVVTPNSPSPSRPKVSKKLLGIVGIVLIAIAIPVTLFVVSKRQTITQQAAPASQVPDNAVATVYGKNILRPELDAFVTSTGKARAEALNMLIEQKILDEESRKTGIGITDPEITARLTTLGIEDFEAMRVFTKYELLKEKILKSQVQYIEAQVISFWLPPLEYPVDVPDDKKQEVARQRSLQKAILTEAQERLSAKENALDVAKSLTEKYPAFSSILMLNGSNVSSSPDEILSQPYIHILKTPNNNKTVLGVLLEGMNQDEAKLLEQPDGSGGMVAFVTEKHSGSFDSYDAWLSDKKAKFTKVY